MRNVKVLVTGIAGFVGSYVGKLLLENGYSVIGIDNFDLFYDASIKKENLSILSSFNNFTFIEADIRKSTDFESIPGRVDGVIHLAAKAGVLPSIKEPEEYINTNIHGTLHLLNWMKKNGTRKLVFASSSSIYGNHPAIPYHEELAVDKPISPYAFTKKSCELLIHNYFHLYGIDSLCLRLFTVYGPRQRPDLAIHKFFRLIIEGKKIPIYGDGNTARDYTFVEDTAAGLVSSLEYLLTKEKVYEIVNLGNSSPVKLIELIEAIGNAVGKQPQLDFYPMQPGDVDITYADINKAKRLLKYNPETTLEDGLAKFNVWIKNKLIS